ncbi:MAG: PD-(D/E)XK nuclease domain-containing protein [Chloroflexota bacterium]
MTKYSKATLGKGKKSKDALIRQGEIEPLCAFVHEHLFSIYHSRDGKDFNELTLKTLFITLLYDTEIYLVDSEPAFGQRFGDLLLMVRPRMRGRGLYDFLLEFKYVKRSKITEKKADGKLRELTQKELKSRSEEELTRLSSVKAAFDETQLDAYRDHLVKKHGDDLNLRCYAIVGLGFERILWRKY